MRPRSAAGRFFRRAPRPPSATPAERALADAAWRLTDPPNIADVCNPSKIPAALLPWLAWGLSADVWHPGEPEGVKRNSVWKSAEMHRLKGTLAGFRRLTELFGAELASVERPPNKTFCGRNYSEAEKDAQLANLPQLRIRSRAQQGRRAAGGIFFRSDYPGQVSKRFLVTSSAASRMRPRTYYYDQGVETELATFEESVSGTGYLQVFRGARRPHGMFCGGVPRFASDCGAAARVYSFRPLLADQTSAALKALAPGLVPINLYPELEYETSTRRGLFAGPRHGGTFVGQVFQATGATWRIYSCAYIFDGTRRLEAHGKSTYVGARRLAQPAYTAELKVRFPGRRSRRVCDRFVHGFTISSDFDLLNRYITALAWSKAARDQVLLDTAAYEPIRAGEQHIAGTGLVAGSMVRRF